MKPILASALVFIAVMLILTTIGTSTFGLTWKACWFGFVLTVVILTAFALIWEAANLMGAWF